MDEDEDKDKAEDKDEDEDERRRSLFIRTVPALAATSGKNPLSPSLRVTNAIACPKLRSRLIGSASALEKMRTHGGRRSLGVLLRTRTDPRVERADYIFHF